MRLRATPVIARPRTAWLLLLAAALGWTVAAGVRSSLKAGDGLVGDYFTNTSWTGRPAVSAVCVAPSTAAIAQGWHGPPPERFSIRWLGFLTVLRSGSYTFITTSDDGSQLIIDGRLVVDNGGEHRLESRSGTIRLDRGSHLLMVRYVQFGGVFEFDWSWSRNGGFPRRVPDWALSQRRAGYWSAVAARISGWGARAFAVVTVLAAIWCITWTFVRYGPPTAAFVARALHPLSKGYRNTASFFVSMTVVAGLLWLPWPDAQGPRLYGAFLGTFRYLHRDFRAVLRRFGDWRQEIDQPHGGEYMLWRRNREILQMLRERQIDRYELSPTIAANEWGLEQIVATAWPHRREAGATMRFQMNAEPLAPGCTLIDRGREISLVACP